MNLDFSPYSIKVTHSWASMKMADGNESVGVWPWYTVVRDGSDEVLFSSRRYEDCVDFINEHRKPLGGIEQFQDEDR